MCIRKWDGGGGPASEKWVMDVCVCTCVWMQEKYRGV